MSERAYVVDAFAQRRAWCFTDAPLPRVAYDRVFDARGAGVGLLHVLVAV